MKTRLQQLAFGATLAAAGLAALGDSSYREMRECRILACTAHTVRLEDIARGERISEPLENVTFSHDEQKYRPMLLIRFPKE